MTTETPHHAEPHHTPEMQLCAHIKPGSPRLPHAVLLDALLADQWLPTSLLSLSEATGHTPEDTANHVSQAICERCTRRFGHALYFLAQGPTDSLTYYLCHYCGHCTRIM